MTRPRTTRSGPEAPLVVYGANAVLELLRGGGPVDRLCLGRGPREAEVSAAARARGVRVETGERAALDRLAGGALAPGRDAVGAPGASGPPRSGCRRGGRGAPGARAPDLRLHGVHPDGAWYRLAQRRGGGRDRALRADRSAARFITPFSPGSFLDSLSC